MKINNHSFRNISIIVFWIFGGSLGFAQGVYNFSVSKEIKPEQAKLLASYGLTSAQLDNFRTLVSRTQKKIEVSFDKTQKIPDFINAEVAFPPEIVAPEEQGFHYFEQYSALYRMKAPRTELKFIQVTKGREGNRNIRYQQKYKGLTVIGAETIVHLHPQNKLWFVQSKYIPEINISINPQVDRARASDIVQKDFVAKNNENLRFTISSADLAILNPWIYDRSFESRNILIWSVVVKETLTGRTFTYFVDARSGQILDIFDSRVNIDSEIWDDQNTNATADDQRWYTDNVVQNIPGGFLDTETSDLNSFVTDYWNFLFNTFQRYSINSASTPDGAQLIAHAYFFSPDCPNAWFVWSIDQAQFCSGMVARDIVAHELTHGLVHLSGHNLGTGDDPATGITFYRNQPGALNESFADVFAEFLDCGMGNCNWLHGPFRDLSNPLNVGQQPDYIGNTRQPLVDHPLYHAPCGPLTAIVCNPNNNDNGGVHTNSGISNIVAYLIVNGTQADDPHYNYHVRGIGLNKAEQLYYGTLTDNGVTPISNFDDIRTAMVSTCNNYANNGTHGFIANDCCQVQSAWASVGVGTACSAFSGGNVSGTCSKDQSPCFITDDATIPAGAKLTIEPNTDVYFFPNTKAKAAGILEANASSGSIRLIGSSENNGLKLSRQFRLKNGGELKMPINTFTSTDTRPHAITLRDPVLVPVPGGPPVPVEEQSFIRIDKGFTISDVNVTIRIAHSNDQNLQVTLESPSHTRVVLFNNVGGGAANFTNTVLDDEAMNAISTGAAPFTGTFQPQASLTAFDGQNAQGYWSLHVVDNTLDGQTGTLDSWALYFNQ